MLDDLAQLQASLSAMSTLKVGKAKLWCTLFLFSWPCYKACRILVSQPGVKPVPLQWKCGVLTTREFSMVHFNVKKYFYLFTFGCAGSSLQHRLFLVAVSEGYTNCGAQASHCRSSSCCEARTLGVRGLSRFRSQVLEHRLSNRNGRLSCSRACGIFPDQGSNPCLLHWQADSLPLSHQRSPLWCILNWQYFQLMMGLLEHNHSLSWGRSVIVK